MNWLLPLTLIVSAVTFSFLLGRTLGRTLSRGVTRALVPAEAIRTNRTRPSEEPDNHGAWRYHP